MSRVNSPLPPWNNRSRESCSGTKRSSLKRPHSAGDIPARSIGRNGAIRRTLTVAVANQYTGPLGAGVAVRLGNGLGFC
jgi:hypothetical protein